MCVSANMGKGAKLMKLKSSLKKWNSFENGKGGMCLFKR
jgi:hypothetical protein